MENRVIIIIGSLCIGVIAWFIFNLDRGVMHMQYYPEFYNNSGDGYYKMRNIFNFTHIILENEEYINETTPEMRAYDLLRASNLENFHFTDQYYSNYDDLIRSGQPVANNALCGQELDWIKQTITSQGDFRKWKGPLGRDLTKYIDSFGAPDSNVFSGSLVWIGSYDSCLKISLDYGRIKTRFCIARYRFSSWPEDDFVHPRPRIRVGICLPETCDTMSFESYRNTIDFLTRIQFNDYYRSNLEVDSMFCLPDERSPVREIPRAGKIYLTLLFAWISIVIVVTFIYENFYRNKDINRCPTGLYDSPRYQVNHSIKERIMLNLSLRNSFKSFMFAGSRSKSGTKAHHSSPRVDFNPISFIRCIMTVLVILVHCSFHLMAYSRTIEGRVRAATSDTMYFFLGLSRLVDSFFIISGLLKTYNLLQKYSPQELTNPILLIKTNISTFRRNIPTFIIIYLFFKEVAPFLGHGPWWDYGVDNLSFTALCRTEPWWKMLLIFSSLDEPSNSMCVVSSWYLTSYLQLVLLVPVITCIIVNLPNDLTRFGLFAFLTLISTLNNAIRLTSLTVVGPEAFPTLGGFIFYLIERYEVAGYFDTLGRLNDVVTGCYAGYIIHLYKFDIIHKWPKWFRSNLTLLISFLIIIANISYLLMGQKLFRATGQIIPFEVTGILFMILQVSYTISNAIFIIHITTINTNSPRTRFMSHSFWIIFNKLNLVLYLINYDIIQKSIQLNENSIPNGFSSDLWKYLGSCLFICIPIAILIYIFFEAPQNNLIRLYKKTIKAREAIAEDQRNATLLIETRARNGPTNK